MQVQVHSPERTGDKSPYRQDALLIDLAHPSRNHPVEAAACDQLDQLPFGHAGHLAGHHLGAVSQHRDAVGDLED
ncbi:hypothetical protein, partial [Nocardioides daeguensis]|uniref:hypothetical protein n=1 Tax=Nocardioides daeguensis TaxID=908359 RepID=UPI002149FC1C